MSAAAPPANDPDILSANFLAELDALPRSRITRNNKKAAMESALNALVAERAATRKLKFTNEAGVGPLKKVNFFHKNRNNSHARSVHYEWVKRMKRSRNTRHKRNKTLDPKIRVRNPANISEEISSAAANAARVRAANLENRLMGATPIDILIDAREQLVAEAIEKNSELSKIFESEDYEKEEIEFGLDFPKSGRASGPIRRKMPIVKIYFKDGSVKEFKLFINPVEEKDLIRQMEKEIRNAENEANEENKIETKNKYAKFLVNRGVIRKTGSRGEKPVHNVDSTAAARAGAGTEVGINFDD